MELTIRSTLASLEGVTDETKQCVRDVFESVDEGSLPAEGDDNPSPEALAVQEEFSARMNLCLERPAAYFKSPPPGSFRIPFERLDDDSVWQVVFDKFSATEQTCLRNELGEELLATQLDRPLVDVLLELLWAGADEEDSVWGEPALECLGPVTRVSLIHSSLIGFAIDLGRAETSDEADQMNACLWSLLSEDDVAPYAAGQELYEGHEAGAEFCLGTTGWPPSGSSGSPSLGPPPPDDSLLWQYRHDKLARLEAISVVDGMVYAITSRNYSNCEALALDASTGELRWNDEQEHKGGCPLTAPHIKDGVLHFGGRGLDSVTGEPLPAGSYSPAPAVGGIAAGAMVYQAAIEDLRAFDAASGDLAWTFVPDETVVPTAVPTASNGVVYIQLYDNVYALDESTGAEIWSLPLGGGFNDGAPVIDVYTLYLTAGSQLYALDAATGQTRWSRELESSLSSPFVGDGLVVVVSGGGSIAFSTAGEELWSNGLSLRAAMIVGGVLYGVDGYLHTVNARTGDIIWSATDFCGEWHPYAVVDGVVYVCSAVGSEDGFGISAYTAPDPSRS